MYDFIKLELFDYRIYLDSTYCVSGIVCIAKRNSSFYGKRYKSNRMIWKRMSP